MAREVGEWSCEEAVFSCILWIEGNGVIMGFSRGYRSTYEELKLVIRGLIDNKKEMEPLF
ncbi:hypothetical protein [Paludifilum halophilum]|uniref:hypothetical protein n=1 Tax=Paludifilum halophilum TaxID=1642702 RepID=UPI00114020E8|nr:hypothetical protein [Paludifilum halophilum]